MTQKIYHDIKVTIADDHETVRIGLQAIFEKESKIEVLDMVSNGLALINSVKVNTPDVILMDIQMPKLNGIEATKRIMALYPQVGIIALTFKDDDDSIIDMIDAGAKGYLIKSALKKEIMEAIVSVYNGKKYFCSSTSERFVDLLQNRNFSRHGKDVKDLFTEREMEIIKLTCREFTAKEIAR